MATSSSGFAPGKGTAVNAENPKTEKPNDAELAVAFYNAVRSEALQRIALREQTLLAWVTVLGVIGGLYFKQGLGDPRLLILVPILSLPFSVLVYRHQYINGRIGDYIETELNQYLRQSTESAPRHWDNSKCFRRMLPFFLRVEDMVTTVLLAALPIGVLLLGARALSQMTSIWIVVGWLCAIASAVLALFWRRSNARH